VAARRLKAIEEYSHLGAGFRIALRDLEIRGAGNILGPEQSGHIQLVGYQMYCEMLADAVKRLKNMPAETMPTASLDLGFTAYIPKNYIPTDRHRMDAYRKIAVAKSPDNLKQVQGELADVYGPVPEEVELLLELAELRIAAARHNIKSVATSGRDLVFKFSQEQTETVNALLANTTGKSWMGDAKTAYLRLPKTYFEPKTLLTLLRKILHTKDRKQQGAEGAHAQHPHPKLEIKSGKMYK
jgi:transcription-repair coupling factor (superfamily II helicase)